MFENDMFGDYERASQVKSHYSEMLLGKPNVVGIGIGLREKAGEYSDEIALVVFVTKKLPSAEIDPADLIPAEIEGVPIDVQEVGEISAGLSIN